MNNTQAAYLRIGTHIRRKDGDDDATFFVVERVEYPVYPNKGDLIVHASGRTFRPWDIERTGE